MIIEEVVIGVEEAREFEEEVRNANANDDVKVEETKKPTFGETMKDLRKNVERRKEMRRV